MDLRGITCDIYGRSVLSDAGEAGDLEGQACERLNAPFGAWCFLTPVTPDHGDTPTPVLMHLLVLGAFRLVSTTRVRMFSLGLNAPFGARCFLTDAYTSIKSADGQAS